MKKLIGMSDEAPQTAEDLIRLYQGGRRDFSGLELDKACLDLRGTSLSHIRLGPGSYVLADFRGPEITGADLSQCNLKTCDFRGADLRNTSFRGSALDATAFEGARMDGADFEGASNHSRTLGPNEQPDW